MGELGDAYRGRIAALAARLDSPTATGARDSMRAELIALGKGLEQDLTELAVLKEDAKALVERWKELQASSAPDFSADRPVVADHIGASTFIEKGWSRISLGDYAGAEETLGKALQLAPNDPQAISLLGWAQMLLEKYDEALMQFQKVLMREPANALARINVGYICLKKRIFGEAIEHLSKAIRLDNDRKATLYAHFYLGLVYLERDMFEDAQTFFQKTLVLGPNLIEAYYELGRAFWFNGQREDAVRTWREGLAANKFNPWAKKCAGMLETIAQGGEP
jgi:tetratricopeptide (TPR) repeat protein